MKTFAAILFVKSAQVPQGVYAETSLFDTELAARDYIVQGVGNGSFLSGGVYELRVQGEKPPSTVVFTSLVSKL